MIDPQSEMHCPVCGLLRPRGRWEFDICSCCLLQFKVTDELEGYTYARYQQRWIESGAKWDGSTGAPVDWNASRQLASIGVDLAGSVGALEMLSENAGCAILEATVSQHVVVYPEALNEAMRIFDARSLSQHSPYYRLKVVKWGNRGDEDEAVVVVHGLSGEHILDIVAVERVAVRVASSWEILLRKLVSRGAAPALICAGDYSALRVSLDSVIPQCGLQVEPGEFISAVVNEVEGSSERRKARNQLGLIFSAEDRVEASRAIDLARHSLVEFPRALSKFNVKLPAATAYFNLRNARQFIINQGINGAFQWIARRMRRYPVPPPIDMRIVLVKAIALEQNTWYRDQGHVLPFPGQRR